MQYSDVFITLFQEILHLILMHAMYFLLIPGCMQPLKTQIYYVSTPFIISEKNKTYSVTTCANFTFDIFQDTKLGKMVNKSFSKKILKTQFPLCIPLQGILPRQPRKSLQALRHCFRIVSLINSICLSLFAVSAVPVSLPRK